MSVSPLFVGLLTKGRGCGDAFVPQNQAWLAGFKFAKSSVFLQTPTFSAKPIVMAALDAVRRGVVVEIYADLEFDVHVSHPCVGREES